MKKVAIAAVLLILASGAFGLFYYVPHQVEARVSKVLSESPWVLEHSLKKVDYSIFSQRAIIHKLNIKLKFSHLQGISIHKLELDNPGNWERALSPSSEKVSSLEAASKDFSLGGCMHDLKIIFSQGAFTIGQIELERVRSHGSICLPYMDAQSPEWLSWVLQLLDDLELERVGLTKIRLIGLKRMAATLAGFELRGLSKGIAEHLQLNHFGLSFPQIDGELSIDKFSASQANLRLCLALANPETGKDYFQYPKIEQLADSIDLVMFCASSPEVRLSYDKLNINQLALHSDIIRAANDPEIRYRFTNDPQFFFRTGPITLKGFQVKNTNMNYTLGLARISINELDHWKRGFSEFKGEIVGLELDPVELDRLNGSKFAEMGYQKLVFNLFVDVKAEPSQNKFTLRRFTIGMEQGFELNLSIAMHGKDIQDFADKYVVLSKMMLLSAELKYQDLSLATRMVNILGKQYQNKLNPLREQLTNLLYELKLKGGKNGSQKAITAVENLLVFLDKPAGIVLICIKPKPPISLLQVLAMLLGPDLELLAERLDLRIKATPSKPLAQSALQNNGASDSSNNKTEKKPKELAPQRTKQRNSMMKPAHLRIKDTSNESKPKSIVQKKQMTNSTYSEGNNISHNPMQQEEISINSDKTQHHPALDSDKKEEAFIFGGKKLSPTHRPHKGNPWPGRIIGPLGASEQKIFYSNWTYRPLCYELYIGDRRRLARMIFGLARFSGDVEQSMPLARFERGAQAFHYTVSQIIDWANAVEKGQVVLNTNEENEFLNILVKDGVLVKRSGIYAAGGLVSHVLGASPGKRRNLSRNINQERWHVMWDEDAIFRNASIYKWKALSKEKKRQALNKLKGYNHENELQTIEEWAVWGKENISVK